MEKKAVVENNIEILKLCEVNNINIVDNQVRVLY